MISFDTDIDPVRRKKQPSMYGYIPDDNGLRGRCFVLMTLIGALHNLSRSTGYALLAAAPGGGALLLLFSGSEITLFLLYKFTRRDLLWWPKLSPMLSLSISFLERIFSKIITAFLAGMFGLWLLLNIVFFCTIDLSFISTFFGTKTAAQYTCELYNMSKEDYQRFDVVFTNKLSYSKNVHEDMKIWVAANIERWKAEEEDLSWLKIEMIDDIFLSVDAWIAEGGAKRRRSSVMSIREVFGVVNNDNDDGRSEVRVRPGVVNNDNDGRSEVGVKSEDQRQIQITSRTTRERKVAFTKLAEDLYVGRASKP